MSPLRLEIRRMVALAVPVAATQLSTMLMGLVDTLMVGRVSVEALGAASIANVWIWAVTLFVNGVLFGIDPIVSQAHGARDGRRLGLALQQGLVLSALLSVPACLALTWTEPILRLAGQDPALTGDAQLYAWMRLPGVPCFLVYSVFRQYLQGRALVRPALVVVLVGNVFNIAANWVLIFGHLGMPELGLAGAGIATSLTRVFSLIALVAIVRGYRLQRGAWLPWSREAFRLRGLGAVCAIGVPIAFQMGLEMWAFSSATLIAGQLGPVPLVAHTIAMNMAALAFMLPLGVAQASTTRVGNLIGAGRPDDAQRAAWVSLALGAGIMTISGAAFVLGRNWLPRLYTPDLQVVAVCAAILPIAGVFQIFDGTQVVACGILRGMGRVRPAMVFNLISYWMLGLPVGAYLALYTSWGLTGLWWGLCLGLAIVASMLLVWIRVRGPAAYPAPLDPAA